MSKYETLSTQKLRIDSKPDPQNLPHDILQLFGNISSVYQNTHPDLKALYTFGSTAMGEWKRGISDIDVVGLTKTTANETDNDTRRERLLQIGDQTDAITFIDNSVISDEEIRAPVRTPTVAGRIFPIATSGVLLWGQPLEGLEDELPTVGETALDRTERVVFLMEKYRSGNIIKPFKENPNLLSRSSAKAAMRVLSGATILRGAPFSPSPYRTAEMVDTYVPEAISVKDQAMEIVEDPQKAPPPEEAMQLADHSVKLFFELFPVAKRKEPASEHVVFNKTSATSTKKAHTW